MDILRDKTFANYNYQCRYINVPYYYNTVDKKYIYGIGKNMLKNATHTRHEVDPSDTLDYLALKYYNDPTFWWVIAYYNDIQDSFSPLFENYKSLLIPNIQMLEFGERY